MARAAHPVRVRRRVRRDGAGRPGRDGLRLGPDQARRSGLRACSLDRRPPGGRRVRGHHRRGTRHDGSRQPRLPRGGRSLRRLQHRAATRAGHEPVRRPRRRVPLLLRPQGDVREVRGWLRDPARRLRHAGRAVRGADPDPDRQGPALPCRPGRPGLLGGAARLDPRHPAGPWHRRRERSRPLPRHGRPRRGRRVSSAPIDPAAAPG